MGGVFLDLKGSDRDLTEIPTRYLHGGTEEGHEKTQNIQNPS
jgi:hypothetical protein